ncbi:MAG: ATP-binding protein, partial [Rhodococcus sp. (in: high G+C Gram-positive bacteria)]|nr:ATP-binding protein [Rhodococcus sp. (in: high G+C Gram-positive bacteria)]
MIEDLTLDLPAPTTPDAPAAAKLILGENAAGKSSLLEAIALAFATPAARKATGQKAKSLLLDPVHMGSTQSRRNKG